LAPGYFELNLDAVSTKSFALPARSIVIRSLEIDHVEGVVLAKLEWMTEECEEGGVFDKRQPPLRQAFAARVHPGRTPYPVLPPPGGGPDISYKAANTIEHELDLLRRSDQCQTPQNPFMYNIINIPS
jgi:hypothetical protein